MSETNTEELTPQQIARLRERLEAEDNEALAALREERVKQAQRLEQLDALLFSARDLKDREEQKARDAAVDAQAAELRTQALEIFTKASFALSGARHDATQAGVYLVASDRAFEDAQKGLDLCESLLKQGDALVAQITKLGREAPSRFRYSREDALAELGAVAFMHVNALAPNRCAAEKVHGDAYPLSIPVMCVPAQAHETIIKNAEAWRVTK